MADAQASKNQRPLSPHLQVYRLPYNAKMSIIGRAVGIGLSIALSAVFLTFIAIVWVPEIYQPVKTFLDVSIIRYAMLFGAFVVFFYIGNGIRHLLWDMVIGVNVKTGIMTGNIVLVVSAVLTLGLWFASCGGHSYEPIENNQSSATLAEDAPDDAQQKGVR